MNKKSSNLEMIKKLQYLSNVKNKKKCNRA